MAVAAPISHQIGARHNCMGWWGKGRGAKVKKTNGNRRFFLAAINSDQRCQKAAVLGLVSNISRCSHHTKNSMFSLSRRLSHYTDASWHICRRQLKPLLPLLLLLLPLLHQ